MRKDLSQWVIHFVHDRKSDDDMSILREICEQECDTVFPLPSYYDEKGCAIDCGNVFYDDEWVIDENALAFDVLQKIIHDGYIKSGWSYRNNSPTIYGPFSAVCFTEMPLYGLIEYARDRGRRSGYVGNYGIAFLRKELFEAGARPVIYGLSTPHSEADDESDPYYGHGQRCLSQKCGIGLSEQYRYVYTNLPDKKDWTHEREWRWPFRGGDDGIAGLPFLLSSHYGYSFSEVVIIVNEDEEQESILDQLKNMYDSKGRNCGIGYNLSLLPAVRVLSLETLSRSKVEMEDVRIEDVGFLQANVRTRVPVTEATRQMVAKALSEAETVYYQAINKYLEENPNYRKKLFDWGGVYIYTDGNTEITQALFDAGIASTFADGRYLFRVGEPRYDEMFIEEKGASAAAAYLTEQLGQSFYIRLMPD